MASPDPWETLLASLLQPGATSIDPSGTVSPGAAPAAAPAAPMAMVPNVQPTLQDRLINFGRALQGGEVQNLTRQAEGKNLTATALRARGIPDADVNAALSNPEMMKQLLVQAFSPKLSKLGPNEALVNTQGHEVYRNADKMVSVSPGAAMFDPSTRQPVFQNAPRPPPGYEPDPNNQGQMRPIPGGPADQKFTEKKNEARTRRDAADDKLSDLENQIKAVLGSQGLPDIYGVPGKFPNWPGGDAANAKANLERLISSGSLAALTALREASKTGGALGNVSNADMSRLENSFAALQQSQSVDQARQHLGDILTQTGRLRTRMGEAFNRQYGGTEPDKMPSRDAPRQQEQRRSLNGKNYVKRNGQWFEE